MVATRLTSFVTLLTVCAVILQCHAVRGTQAAGSVPSVAGTSHSRTLRGTTNSDELGVHLHTSASDASAVPSDMGNIGRSSGVPRRLATSLALPAADDTGRLQWYGRTRTAATKMLIDWAGTSASFRVTGTTTVYVLIEETTKNWYRSIVNGAPHSRILVEDQTPTYVVIADDLDKSKTYDIEFMKVSEPGARVGLSDDPNWATVTAFLIPQGKSAQFLPTPRRDALKLEFIGDGFTTGFGILAPAEGSCDSHDEIMAASDIYYAYGAILCRRYNADCRFTAWSRRGIWRNFDNTHFERSLQTHFHRTLATDTREDYDFYSWKPDAVIIDSGDPDFYDVKRVGDSQPHYEEEVYKFVKAIRRYYNSWVFLFCGPGAESLDHACHSLEVVQHAVRDNRVKWGTLERTSPLNGCNLHADKPLHQSMADQAFSQMAEYVSWELPTPSATTTPPPSSTPSSAPAPSATRTRTRTSSPVPQPTPTTSPAVSPSPTRSPAAGSGGGDGNSCVCSCSSLSCCPADSPIASACLANQAPSGSGGSGSGSDSTGVVVAVVLAVGIMVLGAMAFLFMRSRASKDKKGKDLVRGASGSEGQDSFGDDAPASPDAVEVVVEGIVVPQKKPNETPEERRFRKDAERRARHAERRRKRDVEKQARDEQGRGERSESRSKSRRDGGESVKSSRSSRSSKSGKRGSSKSGGRGSDETERSQAGSGTREVPNPASDQQQGDTTGQPPRRSRFADSGGMDEDEEKPSFFQRTRGFGDHDLPHASSSPRLVDGGFVINSKSLQDPVRRDDYRRDAIRAAVAAEDARKAAEAGLALPGAAEQDPNPADSEKHRSSRSSDRHHRSSSKSSRHRSGSKSTSRKEHHRHHRSSRDRDGQTDGNSGVDSHRPETQGRDRDRDRDRDDDRRRERTHSKSGGDRERSSRHRSSSKHKSRSRDEEGSRHRSSRRSSKSRS